MEDQELLSEILDDTRQLLRASAGRGKDTIAVSPEVAQLLEKTASTDPAPANDAALGESELSVLARTVSTCTLCGLHETRTQTVFGVGNPNADLVFVGEAPGADEDRQGEPFVGRAGKLLTDIIEKGMKLRRQDIYICNVLKCRPPDNRDPNPEEVQHCEPYLIQQLSLIQPKVICALGCHAAQTLLRTTESTGKLRGQWHNYQDIPLRVTYHPAYLLRSPNEKRKTWEDIQEVMKVLNGEVHPNV
jgi:DNA polymerase